MACNFPQFWALSPLSTTLEESLLCGLEAAIDNSGVCIVDRLPPVCMPGVDMQHPVRPQTCH